MRSSVNKEPRTAKDSGCLGTISGNNVIKDVYYFGSEIRGLWARRRELILNFVLRFQLAVQVISSTAKMHAKDDSKGF